MREMFKSWRGHFIVVAVLAVVAVIIVNLSLDHRRTVKVGLQDHVTGKASQAVHEKRNKKTNDQILIELSESPRTSFGKVDFDSQSTEQKVFSAIWTLESEVNNGGFEQYFQNAEQTEIEFIPTALRTIGAVQCAGIVDRAIKVVSIIPPTQNGRQEVIGQLGKSGRDELNALTSEFFEYPDNLSDLLYSFVSQHPETFGAIGRQ